MKTLLIKNTWLSGIEVGWGNGYVIIPQGHPLHGKHYDEIEVEVHGGLTFSELVSEELIKGWNVTSELTDDDLGCWIVGFDTAHYNDNSSNWDQERVRQETESLKNQLENYKLQTA